MVELNHDIFVGFPDGEHLLRVLVRLAVAALLGGVIGFEREREGKAAGVRTQMLVALGAALIVLAPVETGMSGRDLSRVLQGLVTGIGFLGGGTILKLDEKVEVRGLTTAASVWMTAAVGMAVGLGMIWPALLGTALTWIVLRPLRVLDRWIGRHREASGKDPAGGHKP